MDSLALILAFMQVVLKDAKHYTDEAVSALLNGMKYIGAVSYYADLASVDKEVGYVYSVLYAGSSGTVPDGTEYVWGEYDSTLQWIPLGPNISSKADKVSNATDGDIATLDASGNLTDSGKKPTSTVAQNSDDLLTSGAVYAAARKIWDALAGAEDASTASQAYTTGDYFIFDGYLCKATADIAQGDTIAINGNCAVTNVAAELLLILATMPKKISDLEQEYDDAPFEEDDTYWDSQNVAYNNETVKTKLDSLSTAAGISYSNDSNVAAALDGKCDSDKVLVEMIAQSQTSAASVSTPYIVAAPASASAPGTLGLIAFDADYLYVCVDTDTWKRVALSTF